MTKIILCKNLDLKKSTYKKQLDLSKIAINTYNSKMFLKQKQNKLESIVKFVNSVFVKKSLLVQTTGNDNQNGKTCNIERAIEILEEKLSNEHVGVE